MSDMRNTSRRTIEVDASNAEMTSNLSPNERLYRVRLCGNKAEVQLQGLTRVEAANLVRGKVTVTIETWEE